MASFPVLNPRALAATIGVLSSKLEEKGKPKNDRKPIENKSIKLNDQAFETLLSTENFSKIYAQFLIEMPEYSTEGLREIRGTWVKYKEGSDPTILVKSLEGYPLEWCTANFDTAKTQLKGGDFYVYYSLNQDGEPTIPRVAIRMERDRIVEVRGIAVNQNLDPYIAPVIEEKMKEFPDGPQYEKKSRDMQWLTAIEDKIKTKQDLSQPELIFLYEINGAIEGFGMGNGKDPRIVELRGQRDPKKDAPIVLGCTPEEIAYNTDEVNEKTKVYIGEWSYEIHNNLNQSIPYIYESFPEKKIFLRDLELNPEIKDAQIVEKALLEKGYIQSDWELVKHIIQNTPFSKERKVFKLVSFSVAQLGFPNGATTKQIFDKATSLGLELCPAEIGPQLRLQYIDQPMNEYLLIAMNQIPDAVGDPRVFSVDRGGFNGAMLNANCAGDDKKWASDNRFVFVSSK